MGNYSYSDARKRADEHDSFDSKYLKMPKGVKPFKVDKEGVYRLDFIPFVALKGNPHADAGQLHYERTIFVHRDIGPNNDTMVCPNRTFGLPCPVCEFQKKLKSDDGADEKLIKALYPKERQLFQVVDLDTRDKLVQPWDYSYHLFGKLLDARIRDQDEGDNYHLFYHLAKGFTLKVGFTEVKQGKRTWYEAETIDFKTREPYGDKIMDEGFDLDAMLITESYDKLKELFFQEPASRKRDDDRPPARDREERAPDRDRGGRDDDRRSSRDDDRAPARDDDRRGGGREEREPASRTDSRSRDDSPRGGSRESEDRRGSQRDDDRRGSRDEKPKEEFDADRDPPPSNKDDKPKDDDRRRGSREERAPAAERGTREREPAAREERRGSRDDDRRGGGREEREPAGKAKDDWD